MKMATSGNNDWIFANRITVFTESTLHAGKNEKKSIKKDKLDALVSGRPQQQQLKWSRERSEFGKNAACSQQDCQIFLGIKYQNGEKYTK
jgi:hypothetical protein